MSSTGTTIASPRYAGSRRSWRVSLRAMASARSIRRLRTTEPRGAHNADESVLHRQGLGLDGGGEASGGEGLPGRREVALWLAGLPADATAVEHRVGKARLQQHERAAEVGRVDRQHRAALFLGPAPQLRRAAQPDESALVHEAQAIAVGGLVHVVG